MPEDTFHALVGCKFAIKLWRLSRLANTVFNYPSTNFSCFVQTLVDSLSKETFESFVALAWSIWRDMNLFLHNERVNDMSGVVFQAESIIESYQLAQHSSIARGSPTQNHREEQRAAPPDHLYKLNTDASIKSLKGICGLEAIIRNARGKVMATLVCTRLFSEDVEFAEAIAVFQGVRLAINLNPMPLIVVLDSLTIVSLLNGRLRSNKEIGWLVSEIIGLMANRSRAIVKHVPRSCNLVAYNQAKTGFFLPRRIHLD